MDNQLQPNISIGQSVSKPEKNPLMIFLFVFLGMAIIAGSIFVGYRIGFGKSSQTKEPLAQPTIVPSLSAVQPPDATLEWKKYQDPTGQFSFRYPPEYSLDLKKTPYLNRNITWRFSDSSLLECRGDCPIINNKETSSFGGKSSIKLSGYIGSIGGNIPQDFITYQVPSGTKYFIFSIQAVPFVLTDEEMKLYDQNDIQKIKPDDLKIFNQIVSTFKFVDGNQKDNALGMVTGKLCYPSDFLPKGQIIAKNLASNEISVQEYPGSSNGGSLTYVMQLKPGSYHIKYEISKEFAGYYTSYSSCVNNPDAESKSYCIGQQTRPASIAEVKADDMLGNINLCDFYYPPDSPPQF